MVKKILLILVVLLGILAGAISMQPADFSVTREIVIAAPASVIYPHVNTARAWEAWSPWAKVDPNGKFSYEGSESGVGAITRWEGNMELGAGSSTITETHPHERIQFRLDFLKPMKGTDTAEFTFLPAENGSTKVNWTMSGHKNFIGKAMDLVMDCDKMIGNMFDQGLTNLKTLTEAEMAAMPPATPAVSGEVDPPRETTSNLPEPAPEDSD